MIAAARWPALLALAACSRTPGDPVALGEPEGWRRVTGADDPFEGEGPPDADCDTEGIGVSVFQGQLTWDLRTELCPRTTVVQPLARRIRKGEPLTIRAWNFDLSADEPAEAVLAMAVDGEEIWRETIPIPSFAGPILGELPAPRSWPAGAPAAFHIHNHGPNSYHLLEWSVAPFGGAASSPR